VGTLADENTTTSVPVPPPALFDQILYWINALTDDFDLPSFRSAIPPRIDELNDGELWFPPRDGTRGKYHAALTWVVSAEEVALTIDYHHGPMPHANDEREPYAEDLMRWLGRFFATGKVMAHAHVRVRYSTATHATKMPMKLSTDAPFDAELFGVALRLRSQPHGATSVRLTRGQSEWYAEVVGERTVEFERSTPLDDVAAFRDVLALFLEGDDA